MNSYITESLLAIIGFLVGGAIGFTFGSLQNAALERNRKRQLAQGVRTAMTLVPGSFRRTAFLLMTLAVVQVVCPMLFESALVQWLVSAGVVVGYGWTLLRRMPGKSVAAER